MSDTAPPAPLAAKAILAVGSIAFFHAAYSTYEFLGLQKSLGIIGKSVPIDVSDKWRHGRNPKAGPETDVSISREYDEKGRDMKHVLVPT